MLILSSSDMNSTTKKQYGKKRWNFTRDFSNVKIIFTLLQKLVTVYAKFCLIKVRKLSFEKAYTYFFKYFLALI